MRPCDLLGDANITVDTLPFNSNILGNSEKDLDVASIKLDWDLGWATLTSTTAYDNVDVYWGGDLPVYFNYPGSEAYGPDLALTNSQNSESEAWSQEIRFTSPGEDSLRWIAGGYYVNNEREIVSVVGLDTDSNVYDAGFTPIPFGSENPTVGFTHDAQDIKAWAVFGQVAYDVTRKCPPRPCLISMR